MYRQNIKSVDANIRSAHSLHVCDAEMQSVSETDAAATVAA